MSENNAEITQVETTILDHLLRADLVQAGDEIMTPEYAGVVTMIDALDLNSGKAAPPSTWPCLRIFVAEQGGIARFPHELIQVTRATRLVKADEDGEPLQMPTCACCPARSTEPTWQDRIGQQAAETLAALPPSARPQRTRPSYPPGQETS